MSVCIALYVIIEIITSMSFPVCVSINTVHCTVVTVCHNLSSQESIEPLNPTNMLHRLTVDAEDGELP